MTKSPQPESSKKFKRKEEKRSEGTSQEVEYYSKNRMSSDAAGSSSSKKPPRPMHSHSRGVGHVSTHKEKSRERESRKASVLPVRDSSNESEGRSPVRKDSMKKKKKSLTKSYSEDKMKRSAERNPSDGKTKRSSSEKNRSEGRSEQPVERDTSKGKKKRSRTRNDSVKSEEQSSGEGTAEKEKIPKIKRKRASDSSIESTSSRTLSSTSSKELSFLKGTIGGDTPRPTDDSPGRNNETLPPKYLSKNKNKTTSVFSSEVPAGNLPTTSEKATVHRARGTSKKGKKRLSSKSHSKERGGPLPALKGKQKPSSSKGYSEDSDDQLPVEDSSEEKSKRSCSKGRSTSNKNRSDSKDATKGEEKRPTKKRASNKSKEDPKIESSEETAGPSGSQRPIAQQPARVQRIVQRPVLDRDRVERRLEGMRNHEEGGGYIRPKFESYQWRVPDPED